MRLHFIAVLTLVSSFAVAQSKFCYIGVGKDVESVLATNSEQREKNLASGLWKEILQTKEFRVIDCSDVSLTSAAASMESFVRNVGDNRELKVDSNSLPILAGIFDNEKHQDGWQAILKGSGVSLEGYTTLSVRLSDGSFVQIDRKGDNKKRNFNINTPGSERVFDASGIGKAKVPLENRFDGFWLKVGYVVGTEEENRAIEQVFPEFLKLRRENITKIRNQYQLIEEKVGWNDLSDSLLSQTKFEDLKDEVKDSLIESLMESKRIDRSSAENILKSSVVESEYYNLMFRTRISENGYYSVGLLANRW